MQYSISSVLFDWLQRKRLISAVARRMGVNESTLMSQLRPTTNTSKFAADDLLPLCEAIRDAGYGEEMIGIIREYTDRLVGEIKTTPESGDLQLQMVKLMSGIGSVSAMISDTARHSSEKDLVELLNKLRTEVLPIIVHLEVILSDRLAASRGKIRNFGPDNSDPIPEH